jgi:hypothetical protein
MMWKLYKPFPMIVDVEKLDSIKYLDLLYNNVTLEYKDFPIIYCIKYIFLYF